MAASTFDGIWVPRIGEDATAELRRNGYLTLVLAAGILAVGVGCSFAFSSGNAGGIAVGIVLLALAAALIAVWLRSRRRLASAVSRWFGAPIGWQEMPRMRAREFDAWCERRNLRAPGTTG